MNIRQKLVITLITAFSLNLAVILYASYTYKQEIQRTTAITEQAFRIVTDSLSAQVHFKKQVQEWKNILLRGHEKELYTKYQQQFFQEEINTRSQIDNLLQQLKSGSETWHITNNFLGAHNQLGKYYREALKQFDPTNNTTHIDVDQLVRGIDREPTDLIDQLVSLTNRDKATSLHQINTDLALLEFQLQAFSMTLLILTVLALTWLADHFIAHPIRIATQVAHRISKGDLSGSVPTGGVDEAGQLMAAMKSMQTNLSAYQEKLHQQQSQLAGQVERRTQALNIANTKLARAVKAKDFFLATMSHELRTPLTTILGLTELLTDKLYGPINDAQKKALDTLDESSRHLLTLINDILDVAKVESGKMELNWDYLPIEHLIEASLRLVKQSAIVKKHQIKSNLDPQVQLIHGDGRRLKQVLVNLLSNAIKFTPEGGVIGLEVTGHPERNQISLCVWDSGIGIEPSKQDNLFNPFVQLDSEPTRLHSGTGLGLALVKRMTELHNGEVNLQSDPGHGSRFTVTLPWTMHDNLSSNHPITSPPGQRANNNSTLQKNVRLLLADGNSANRKMIGDFLKLNGFQVIYATEGKEAIKLAIQHTPQILLIDVQLNALDGLEVTRVLRQHPEFSQTPIIALTALAMPGDRESCLHAGMDAYLSKPVGLKELHQKLLAYL